MRCHDLFLNRAFRLVWLWECDGLRGLEAGEPPPDTSKRAGCCTRHQVLARESKFATPVLTVREYRTGFRRGGRLSATDPLPRLSNLPVRVTVEHKVILAGNPTRMTVGAALGPNQTRISWTGCKCCSVFRLYKRPSCAQFFIIFIGDLGLILPFEFRRIWFKQG